MYFDQFWVEKIVEKISEAVNKKNYYVTLCCFEPTVSRMDPASEEFWFKMVRARE